MQFNICFKNVVRIFIPLTILGMLRTLTLKKKRDFLASTALTVDKKILITNYDKNPIISLVFSTFIILAFGDKKNFCYEAGGMAGRLILDC